MTTSTESNHSLTSAETVAAKFTPNGSVPSQDNPKDAAVETFIPSPTTHAASAAIQTLPQGNISQQDEICPDVSWAQGMESMRGQWGGCYAPASEEHHSFGAELGGVEEVYRNNLEMSISSLAV